MSDEQTKFQDDYRAAVASMLARLESLEAHGVRMHAADAKWRKEETERAAREHAEAIARQDALNLERIRDGFAAAALGGMLASETSESRFSDNQGGLAAAAHCAYLYADAMMEERKR
jgi:hypothetical protein